jgi:hypothetical protein
MVLRDDRQIPIAYLEKVGFVTRLYDKYGSKLLGTYNASNNATYTVNGKFIGNGNLLITLIK